MKRLIVLGFTLAAVGFFFFICTRPKSILNENCIGACVTASIKEMKEKNMDDENILETKPFDICVAKCK